LKVLITGGCGYIGSKLAPLLKFEGDDITVVDPQMFGNGLAESKIRVVKEDVRDHDLRGYHAIIHLASVSNNDMYAAHPELMAINRWVPDFDGRLIYASSVAAYGSSDEVFTEDSPLNPNTPYGEDKARCEEIVLSRGGVVVRAASVCGHSTNMRFDTPVNRMTRDALAKRHITVNGGSQTRCHIHLDDVCDFYALLLRNNASGAFNLVCDSSTILETAERVARTVASGSHRARNMPFIQVNEATDSRSYKVSGEKMKQLNFMPIFTVSDAIHGMCNRAGHEQYGDFSPQKMRML
jgi:nucleoside-diphosphate-sugar epimerase